jgi:hypothetical protein
MQHLLVVVAALVRLATAARYLHLAEVVQLVA